MHVPDRHAEWRRQKGNHNSLPDARGRAQSLLSPRGRPGAAAAATSATVNSTHIEMSTPSPSRSVSALRSCSSGWRMR